MKRITRSGFAGMLIAASFAADAAEGPADTVYRHGKVYTVDAADSVHEALAVRDGRIVFVGDAAGAAKLTGEGTEVVDLGGRVMMPGLVDAHMHPLSAGRKLVACSLDYASLSVAEFQARIQACLDATK
ncbi:MAG: amidohydrolase family protein, partial [Thermoanaerobaculia bacterium]|nr:amidohydrolase family protein [Thermoanaerobaculia bacterium]